MSVVHLRQQRRADFCWHLGRKFGYDWRFQRKFIPSGIFGTDFFTRTSTMSASRCLSMISRVWQRSFWLVSSLKNFSWVVEVVLLTRPEQGGRCETNYKLTLVNPGTRRADILVLLNFSSQREGDKGCIPKHGNTIMILPAEVPKSISTFHSPLSEINRIHRASQ
jgi:hypothetical protein